MYFVQKFRALLLQASLLHYARSITEAAAEGAAILDCVITVPAFWGPNQRQALIDAAKVAGEAHTTERSWQELRF